MPALRDEAVQASVAAQTVRAIAHATGCAVEVQSHRGTHSEAIYRGRRRPGLVRLGGDALAASAECQQWIGAHEMAHLVRRHGGRLFAWLAPLVFVGTLAAVGLVAVSTTSSVVLGLCAATFVVLSVGLFLGPAAWCRSSRHHEVEADSLATDWGYPMTPAIAAWLESTEPAVGSSWLGRHLRTHPLPLERLAHQEARVRQQRTG